MAEEQFAQQGVIDLGEEAGEFQGGTSRAKPAILGACGDARNP